MELKNIKTEAKEATTRGSFHPIRLSVGDRKIPPPIPEIPESNPRLLPSDNFFSRGGVFFQIV